MSFDRASQYIRIEIHVNWCSQLTQYARNIPSVGGVVPPEDEQVMLETCRGP
jgi:hypothetical protein